MFGSAKKAALRFIFDRYMGWRLNDISGKQFIELDYDPSLDPRWGYGKQPHAQLQAIFEQSRAAYVSWLTLMVSHSEQFFKIAQSPNAELAPTFQNGYFLGLDPIALYTILVAERPKLYLEVGSGHSTRFARKAIRDHNLPTRIVSIDPHPRVDVEALCDENIRSRFEDTDLHLVDRLGPGDILFIDNSHRSFENSDVTVFFLETLPRLKPGIIIHIHDIMLPLDYPPHWRKRYYNEQYLLGCWLLANPGRFQLMLSNAFVSSDRELCDLVAPIWDDPRFTKAKAAAIHVMKLLKGQSFWARLT